MKHAAPAGLQARVDRFHCAANGTPPAATAACAASTASAASVKPAATAASASSLASLAGDASPSPGAGEARFFEPAARLGLGLAAPASSLGGGSSSSSAHLKHRAARSAPVARGGCGAARCGAVRRGAARPHSPRASVRVGARGGGEGAAPHRQRPGGPRGWDGLAST